MTTMTTMMRDLLTAARSLRRSKGYVAAFVLTLGLGVGVNTAIFSVVNGVLLEPLPFKDADRIMYVRQPATRAGVPNASFSFQEVEDYRRGVQAFDEVVEYGDWTFNVVPPEGEPHRSVAGLVTANYFDVMGMEAVLGRTLEPSDDGEGAEPVMVLTHEYWSRVHGADPSVLDTKVDLSGFGDTPKTTRIVGVLAPGSHYTGSRRQEFYTNYATNDHYLGATMQDERTHRMTDVFARLAPGAGVAAARAETRAVAEQLHRDHPDAYPADLGMDVSVAPWQEELTRDARPTFLILMGTVLAVLVLACANVANLTLTRLVRKEQELATRVALGATRARIRRELLAENLVLALGGAVLGLVLAFASLGLLVDYASRLTVRTGEIGIDGAVLGFTLLASVAVAVLLAWAPGMPLAPSPAAVAGSAGGRVAGNRARRKVQRGLVVAQLALSFALLIGASLLVRTLLELYRVDPGFEAADVLTFEAQGTGKTADENRQLFEAASERIRAYPGVREVAVASWPPLRSADPIAWSFRVEGGDESGTRSARATFNGVTPSYFDLLGIRLLAGRTLGHMDMAESERVVVINESMARAYFGADDPLGRRVAWSYSGTNWSEYATVVGVVADTREHGLAETGVHTVYRPAAQMGWGPAMVVRTRGDAAPLARHAKDVIHELDPTRPVDEVYTLEELRSDDVAPERLNATLFGTFAALALLIAAVGILGVLAFSVSQRTREFGVRMAVGARQGEVLGMVLREGAALVVLALALGGVGGAALSRLLSGLLYEIRPLDPASFVVAGVLLAAVALLAAYIPARRATLVDPSLALRSE